MLLVEDDAVLARSLGRLLSAVVEVTHAASLQRALEQLAAPASLEVVWSDRHLLEPDDGIEVLLEARRTHPSALLLLVSGTVDRRGLERLPPDVLVIHKSRTSAATRLVLERFGGDSAWRDDLRADRRVALDRLTRRDGGGGV